MTNLQTHMSLASQVNKVRYIAELKTLRQEHPSFPQVFKRKFTRQSWNKKPGKPRKIIIEDEERVQKKLFLLKDNNYSFRLY